MNFNRRRPPRPRPRPYDFGRQPYVTDLNGDAARNNNYRTAIWTGENLQMTLMSINVNQDVGLEQHKDVDQFFYIVSGIALVLMGNAQNNLSFRQTATRGYGIFIPVGTWHNIVNAGDGQLKVFTVYAPPEHPPGTVEVTNPEAEQPQIPTYPPIIQPRPPRPNPPVLVIPPVYPPRPGRPPSTVFPQVPLYPSTPTVPPSGGIPQTPMYPADPAAPAFPVPVTPAMPIAPMPFAAPVFKEQSEDENMEAQTNE